MANLLFGMLYCAWRCIMGSSPQATCALRISRGASILRSELGLVRMVFHHLGRGSRACDPRLNRFPFSPLYLGRRLWERAFEAA